MRLVKLANTDGKRETGQVLIVQSVAIDGYNSFTPLGFSAADSRSLAYNFRGLGKERCTLAGNCSKGMEFTRKLVNILKLSIALFRKFKQIVSLSSV